MDRTKRAVELSLSQYGEGGSGLPCALGQWKERTVELHGGAAGELSDSFPSGVSRVRPVGVWAEWILPRLRGESCGWVQSDEIGETYRDGQSMGWKSPESC